MFFTILIMMGCRLLSCHGNSFGGSCLLCWCSKIQTHRGRVWIHTGCAHTTMECHIHCPWDSGTHSYSLSLSVYGCTCMRECFSPIFNQEYGLSIWQQYLLISCSDFAVFPLSLSNSSCSHSGCFCVLVNLLLTDLSHIFWLCDPIKIHQPIVCKV